MSLAELDGYVELDHGVRGFSCPHSAFDDDLLAAVSSEYAKGVVERFIRRHGAELVESGAGLTALFNSWLARHLGFDQTWEPVFSTLGEILANRSRVTVREAAARLALLIQEQGTPGEWRVQLTEPANLRWHRWQLDREIIEIGASSDGLVAKVETVSASGHAKTYAATGRGNDWQVSGATPYPQVQFKRRSSIMLRGDGIRSPEFSFLEQDVADTASDEQLAGRFAEAAALLRRYAPEYLLWVDRVMRYIIPLKGGPDRIVSGSTRGQSGVSHISADAGPAEIAEMLVHESAHHYYYLITRLQPVHDGSDAVLYYSPIKQRGRPIYFIHLAYHAFANVLLLGRKCRRRGYNDPGAYFACNEHTLVPQLAKLEEALRTTKSLTPVGNALWEPLSQQVRSA
jgi:hypothetical protein